MQRNDSLKLSENLNKESGTNLENFLTMTYERMAAILAEIFDEWMQTQNRYADSDSEHLLNWFLKNVGIPCYRTYLALVQAVAEKNYKTSIDVPISKQEFEHHIHLQDFSEWMTRQDRTKYSDTDFLLLWYKTNVAARSYEDFLVLAQTAAKKGFATAFDIPIREQIYRARFLSQEAFFEQSRNLLPINFFTALNTKVYQSNYATLFDTKDYAPSTIIEKSDVNINHDFDASTFSIKRPGSGGI